MPYTSITVEGGLFPAEVLDKIARGDAEVKGQKPADFGIKPGLRVTDDIQSALSAARSYWDAFQARLGRSAESRTTLTRQYWVSEFLELLGFQLEFQAGSLEAAGEKYAISHRAGGLPVHIVSVEESLDSRTSGRRSPHAMVQEYLNHTDIVWGMVTNGKTLRLLRQAVRLSKPTYLEFSLEGIVAGNLYGEFSLLYRLLHATRFAQQEGEDKSLIDGYYNDGVEEGGRVREKLRIGVEQALKTLGTALLKHPRSDALRKRFVSGELTAQSYYRQLLRLVYRFLFLAAAEERHLLFPSETLSPAKYAIYRENYSMNHLRDRADRYFKGDTNIDLWLGLIKTFDILRDDVMAKQLGLVALNGELFSRSNCSDPEGATLTNEELLQAIRWLSLFEDDRTRRRVNYAGMDVEEFGSVYESLLDYHPKVDTVTRTFSLVAGSERKQTGSYYTAPELVHELIESALVPTMQDRLKGLKTANEREEAILGIRVCDPAAGSGHFLLAAARTMAHGLAGIRSSEQEPSPTEYRKALRDVVRTCLYAVDKNELAVDLCKVALWMEGHCAGYPLGFLDHHIKHGDSLVGVMDLKVLSEGIPDGAYDPVTKDDKTAAKALKNRNSAEKKGQLLMFAQGQGSVNSGGLAEDFGVLSSLEEQTPKDVHEKENLYNQLRSSKQYDNLKGACDLWTSAFFLPIVKENALNLEGIPTTQTVKERLKSGTVDPRLGVKALSASFEHAFFHWPLEFPDVFQKGGFDVVLGNPPWDVIQPEELKFFGPRDAKIAELMGSERKRAIEHLDETNPELAKQWSEHKTAIERFSRFLRTGLRFGLTAKGRVNLYAVFAETTRSLTNNTGSVGFIVPSGIATDHTTSDFFADLIEKRSLVSLFDFENRLKLFPAVDSRVKFCLLTLTGSQEPRPSANFAFFLHRAEQLRDAERVFSLSPEDFKLINPNTLTCPIFRTKRDAEITKGIFSRVPVLVNEKTGENPWGVRLMQGLFNMTSDSHLFSDKPKPGYVPLYEAKLMHQFDHRWATYENGETRDLTDAEKDNPDLTVTPRYWVPKAQVDETLDGKWDRGWLIGFRDIARATDERTAICTVLPRTAIGHKVPLILGEPAAANPECLSGNLCSLALDFVARSKVGGTSLGFFILYQFPILPPSIYFRTYPWTNTQTAADWMRSRALELTYTALDLRAFAEDMGFGGLPFHWDIERRFAIRCELDAAFFHLYGIGREDLQHIMETFSILKRKDEHNYGEYRTKHVILDIYDEMATAINTGAPYRTHLNPPPGDPRAARQS